MNLLLGDYDMEFREDYGTGLVGPPYADNLDLILTHGDADGVIAGGLRLRSIRDRNEEIMRYERNLDAVDGQLHSVHLGTGWKGEMAQTEQGVGYLLGLPAQASFLRVKVFVQDINHELNEKGVKQFLEDNCEVEYVDHRGKITDPEIIGDSRFTNNIDASTDTNTTHILYKQFNRAHPEYTIIGLAGDRKESTVDAVANEAQIPSDLVKQLRTTGYALNTNSIVGESTSLPAVHPIEFPFMMADLDVQEFLRHPNVQTALKTRQEGMDSVYDDLKVIDISPSTAQSVKVYVLPDSDTGRGFFSDVAWDLQASQPNEYHFVVSPRGKKSSVSMRGPDKISEFAKALGGGVRETAGHASVEGSIDDVINTIKSSEVYKTL